MQGIFRITDSEDIKKVKVDVKDKKILTLLSQNSRMALTEIASSVMLSRDSVAYRVKRLEKLGVVCGFFPIIDLSRLGYYTFRTYFLTEETNQQRIKELIEHLKSHPNVISLIEYTDRWDLEVVYIARNLEEFDNILIELTTRFNDVILEKETLENIKEYYYDFLPTNTSMYVEGIKLEQEDGLEDVDIDSKDFEILKILCEDSRKSTYEIGESVGINADTVSYRIKKMRSSGVIKQFTIMTNVNLLDNSWYTLLVRMKSFDKKSEERFKEFCKQHKFIIMATKVFGSWDIVAYLTSTKSKNLLRTMKDIKIEFSNIIKNYEIYLGYKEHIYKPFPEALNGPKS